MLTRLQVDGFKNLLGVDVDFGPFTCIAGENAAGKSNLLDAIAFLSLLADVGLDEAAGRLRAWPDAGGDPDLLFWTDGKRRADRMRLAAEMIVPAEVTDDVGRPAEPSITFLRYAVELGRADPRQARGPARLVLLSEELRHVRVSDASAHLRFPHKAGVFRSAVVTGRRGGTAFLSTEAHQVENEGAVPFIHVHQDGGTGAEPHPTRADRAGRTVLSTTTTSALPTLLAARRELQSWRRFDLDPAPMRRPDPLLSTPQLGADGSGLSAVLARQLGEGPGAPARKASFMARLGRLADISGVQVDPDPLRGLWSLRLQEPEGRWLPAWAQSDGTLRVLALAALAGEGRRGGLVAVEEPENGIHPARLGAVLASLRELAVDATQAPGPDNPLQQVILTTHSPGLLRLVDDGDLLLARRAPTAAPCGGQTRGLRLDPVAGSWRCDADQPGVARAQAAAALSATTGAQVDLI